MEPIAVTVRGEGRWVLIHRCTQCGRLRLNRAAGDDNLLLLMRLAALPLAMLPAPYMASGTWADGQAATSTDLGIA
jgi:RNHCP domain